MGQIGPFRRGVGDHGPGRGFVFLTVLVAVLVSAVSGCSMSAEPDVCAAGSPTLTTSPTGEKVRHSVSLGLEDVIDPDADWDALSQHLDAAGVNTLHLSAGRVEFTAFRWDEHKDVAAEGRTDHLSTALGELCHQPSGSRRLIDISIDALIPNWIKADPSVAGRDVDGRRSIYFPSASAIMGKVGDRYVAYAKEIARRYHPDQISFTELKFDDETFGDDDLALYRKMTGADDWPRDASGAIDQDSAKVSAWRADIMADLLSRVRVALDQVVQDEGGRKILLATDAPVNWDDPGVGRPSTGKDYQRLDGVVDRIILWAYFGSADRRPADVERLTASLADSGVGIDRFTVSIGLWSGPDTDGSGPQEVITPGQLGQGVKAAQTSGVTSVNVTPVSLMTEEHWAALERVWGGS